MRLALVLSGLLGVFSVQAQEIDRHAALAALQQPDSLLIDVRSADEFAAGALPGAIRIGHADIAAHTSSLGADKNRPLVLYCRSGRRSALAQQRLEALGYRHVINAGAYDELRPLLERGE